jgi:hypothetical protein
MWGDVMDGENQRGFAEIEVTPEAIVIRRVITEEKVSEIILRQVSKILISVAEELEGVRSPWDGENISAEEAYSSAIAAIAVAIREGAMRGLC